MKHSELRGKTVVVTGASSGIGRATAIAFAAREANVVLAGRRQALLEEVRRQIEGQGAESLVVPTDVVDGAQVKALVETSLRRFGTIDVFVANAGLYCRCPVRKLTVEQVKEVMDVNFHGCLRCLLEVLPHMIERGDGHVVVVSSVDGKKGLPPDGAYVASKYALSGLADVLRQELRGTGVHLSTIFPGRIDTPMIADLQVPSITAKIPPERVADAIVKAVLERKGEVYVPRLSSKVFVLTSVLAPVTTDRLIRRLRLSGWNNG